MNHSPNKRQFTRVPIAYRVKVMAEERTIHCPSAINVSMNGILVQAPERLPLGTSCYIVIFLLAEGVESKILAWGMVVRDCPEGMAIRFSKILGQGSQDLLRSLVLVRSSDPEQAKREFEDFARPIR